MAKITPQLSHVTSLYTECSKSKGFLKILCYFTFYKALASGSAGPAPEVILDALLVHASGLQSQIIIAQ